MQFGLASFFLLGAQTSPSALSAKREMIFSELTIRTKDFAPDGAMADGDVRAPS